MVAEYEHCTPESEHVSEKPNERWPGQCSALAMVLGVNVNRTLPVCGSMLPLHWRRTKLIVGGWLGSETVADES